MFCAPIDDLLPAFTQVLHIRTELSVRGFLGDRSGNETAALIRRNRLPYANAQGFALALIIDSLTDADMGVQRQIDQESPRDRQMRRQSRPFGTDRILDDLNHQAITFVEQPLNRQGSGKGSSSGPSSGRID